MEGLGRTARTRPQESESDTPEEVLASSTPFCFSLDPQSVIQYLDFGCDTEAKFADHCGPNLRRPSREPTFLTTEVANDCLSK